MPAPGNKTTHPPGQNQIGCSKPLKLKSRYVTVFSVFPWSEGQRPVHCKSVLIGAYLWMWSDSDKTDHHMLLEKVIDHDLTNGPPTLAWTATDLLQDSTWCQLHRQSWPRQQPMSEPTEPSNRGDYHCGGRVSVWGVSAGGRHHDPPGLPIRLPPGGGPLPRFSCIQDLESVFKLAFLDPGLGSGPSASLSWWFLGSTVRQAGTFRLFENRTQLVHWHCRARAWTVTGTQCVSQTHFEDAGPLQDLGRSIDSWAVSKFDPLPPPPPGSSGFWNKYKGFGNSVPVGDLRRCKPWNVQVRGPHHRSRNALNDKLQQPLSPLNGFTLKEARASVANIAVQAEWDSCFLRTILQGWRKACVCTQARARSTQRASDTCARQ
jgi:hypothetical protein